MGLFSKLISATVKTILTPVAVVKDVVNIATDKKADSTKKLLESAGDDLDESIKDLGNSEII